MSSCAMEPGTTQEDTLIDLCGQWLLPASLSSSLGTLRELCCVAATWPGAQHMASNCILTSLAALSLVQHP